MAIIKQDIYGLYTVVGGYIARPVHPTLFILNDKVEGKHFGSGSGLVGLGKKEGRGQYKEYWKTSGTSTDHKNGIIKTISMYHGY